MITPNGKLTPGFTSDTPGKQVILQSFIEGFKVTKGNAERIE